MVAAAGQAYDRAASARLARAVRARREELNLAQRAYEAAGGVTAKTLRSIERGNWRRTAQSAVVFAKLDGPLQWVPGTAERIYGEASGIDLPPSRLRSPRTSAGPDRPAETATLQVEPPERPSVQVALRLGPITAMIRIVRPPK